MKRTILGICAAVLIFMCSSLSALAAVCPDAPDGVHHFTAHQSTGLMTARDGGTHSYLYGYDHNGKAIYKNDCRVTIYDVHCRYKCEYCTVVEENSWHMHSSSKLCKHSVNHK